MPDNALTYNKFYFSTVEDEFEALLMAVISANTDWSKIERVQAELSELFSGFNLEWYAVLSDAEIGCRFPPWFTERKAGSMTLARDLVNLAATARILLDYSRTHGTADCYFTSLMHRCGGDPKLAYKAGRWQPIRRLTATSSLLHRLQPWTGRG